jgi:hypothetical protein
MSKKNPKVQVVPSTQAEEDDEGPHKEEEGPLMF